MIFAHPFRPHSAIVLIALFLVGCSKSSIYPVSGKIVDMDGNPITELKGCAIEFDSIEGKSSATSAIDENASFRLTTLTPGDGAHVGANRVVITRPNLGPETPAKLVILPKYEKYETSGLEVNVEPKNNVIDIKVELIKARN